MGGGGAESTQRSKGESPDGEREREIERMKKKEGKQEERKSPGPK